MENKTEHNFLFLHNFAETFENKFSVFFFEIPKKKYPAVFSSGAIDSASKEHRQLSNGMGTKSKNVFNKLVLCLKENFHQSTQQFMKGTIKSPFQLSSRLQINIYFLWFCLRQQINGAR